MPDKVEISQWQCSRCHTGYPVEQDAVACEVRHEECDYLIRWYKVFPRRHHNDCPALFHCVACGTILEIWLTDDFYGRTCRAERSWQYQDGIVMVFDGSYCKPCGTRLKNTLLELMECYLNEKRKQEENEAVLSTEV